MEGGAPEEASAKRGPVAAANDPFVDMEDVLEKLKILDYEQHFCETAKCKPLTRTQFADPKNQNPAENFKLFASLVQWLMVLNGNYTEQWDRFTDPNVTVANMMSELRTMGINLDIPPHKLKNGHGPEVCSILSSLCDITLQKQKIVLKKPVHHPDAYTEDAPPEVDEADEMEEMADDVVEEEEDPEEEDMFVAGSGGAEPAELETSILESKVDPHQWRLELERVAPQLKVVLQSAGKEWRSHLDAAVSLDKQFSESLPTTKESLKRIEREVSEVIEKITKRELHYNRNCDSLISQYREVQDQLNEKQADYGKNNVHITELTNELAQVSDELENVKSQMDERGQGMTDTSPLLNIKKALSRLKAEGKQMELQIGAVEHALLQVNKKQAKGGG